MSKKNNYSLRPLKEQDARDILRWRYEQPFDFYDPPDDGREDHYVAQFLRPEFNFHAVTDSYGRFIGFCSYGADGQVPGGDYSEEALDIGLGMKPEFTGQGRGIEFFTAIVEYAKNNLMPGKLRLTVANFNERAVRLYEKSGFIRSGQFNDSLLKVHYTIMVLDC